MAQLFHLTGQALRDTAGNPYTSAKAFFYETGTTTPKDTYSNAGLTIANANPVIADGTTGLFPDIYLLAGRYKVVLQQSDGTSIDTWDPVDATSQMIAASSAPSPTYAFLRYHNTTDGNVYRRNAANSAWINEGPVDTLLNAATVTEQLAGTETGKSSTPDSVAALWQRGADIAASSTISLPSTGGHKFNLTGLATTINGISSAQGGRSVRIRSNAAHTFTHNGTSFILPGAVNRVAASGDIYEFDNEAAADLSGSAYRMTGYVLASGSPLNINDQIASKAEMEAASDITKAASPGRVQNHPGVAKAWGSFVTRGTNGAATINASHNVTGISRTAAGTYAVTLTTANSSANYVVVGTCEGAIGSNVLVTSGTKATGSFNILTQSASAGSATDIGTIDFVVYGDQ